MIRRILTYVSTLFLATGMLTFTDVPAQASSSTNAVPKAVSVIVRIPDRSIKIGADGSVRVAIRVRCDTGINVFEFDASVQQGSVLGAASVVEPNLTPCDGRVHTLRLSMKPESGTFVPGPASVNVFLGAFDPVAGDIDATSVASILLR